MPQNAIWLYGYSGGFSHDEVDGAQETDYYADALGLPVDCEDFPYWSPESRGQCYVTKRHLNGFNTVTVSGVARWIEWGTSTEADWVE